MNPGVLVRQGKESNTGGRGCVKTETINAFIFYRLPLFENYFQSVMSHCGSRMMLNNAAGGWV